MDKIFKRSDKVAFYEIDGVYKRMKGFTDFSISKNPTEYTRKYVDEQNERNDVVSYNPIITFAFDRFSSDEVQSDMIAIADREAVGPDAIRNIIMVDLTAEPEDGFPAQRRSFVVVPDTEGNDGDTYTYSGTLKANGEVDVGYATTKDGWRTASFKAEWEA